MSTNGQAILYKNFITPKKRCLNAETFALADTYTRDNGNHRYVVQTGCFVSNSTGYFDFFLPSLNTTLENYGYAVIGGARNEYLYYAVFIERYELNNFTYQDNDEATTYNPCYRAYFTVDWWTTNQLRKQPDILIRGAVNRAHLCDNTLSIEGSPTNIKLDSVRDYLTLTQEYAYSHTHKYKNTTQSYWLYIALATGDNNALKRQKTVITSDEHRRDAKSLTSQYVICVFKYYPDDNNAYMVGTIVDTVKGFPSWVDTEELIIPLESIVEETIVFMTISSVPPSQNLSTLGGARFYYSSDVSTNENDSVSLAIQKGDTVKQVKIPLFTKFDGADLYSFSNLLFHGQPRADTFERYLQHATKSLVHPYTKRRVTYGNTSFDWNILWENGQYVYVAIEPNTFDLLCWTDSDLLQDEEKWRVLLCDSKFTPVYSKGEYNTQMLNSATLNVAYQQSYPSRNEDLRLMNMLGNAGQTAQSAGITLATAGPAATIATGAVSVAGQLFSSAIQYELDSQKASIEIARSNANVVQLTRSIRGTAGSEANMYVLGVNSFSFTIEEPVARELDTIRYKMALYGYDTTLSAEEILTPDSPHIRENFNYIQTAGCVVDTSLTAEATAQIKAMFDGGVWLFNKYAFNNQLGHGKGFDLECVNYPLTCYTSEEKGE